MENRGISSRSKMKHVKVYMNSIFFRNHHLHKEIELCFMLEGEALFKTKDGDFRIKQGDVILLNSNDAHSIEAKDGRMLGLFFQISNHFFREYCPALQWESFESCLLRQHLDMENLFKVFRSLFKAASSYFKEEPYFQFDVASALTDLFVILLRNLKHETISENERNRRKRSVERLNRVVDYVHENIAGNIRLSEIAEKEGLTTTHLSHEVSERFGLSFQDYVSSCHLEEAIRLMCLEDKTMLEISKEAGFSDQKYMTKMFLKQFGVTPKQFKMESVCKAMEEGKHISVTDVLERPFTEEESIRLLNQYPLNFGY